ncbi:MAG: methyltransferase domain-containing protein [Bacillaceae bacterium]|nr:methyltransferase domain-containing protein [Bacillaceae bacterium]
MERTPHELKQKIQERFGRNARSYVTSQVHAGGEDLNYLRKEVERTGGQRALDVATGGGHVAHTLAPFFDRVTAYDLTANMLESARDFIEGNGIQNVDFTQGDAESMPFQDESFDLAACRVAAHHFTDVRSFLHETHRVLTPGSRFLLIDNVSPEQDDWDRLYNEMEKRRDPGHHRALKKSEWLRLIELSGFEPVACRVFQKQLQFDDWCDRMQLSEQEKIDLTRFMLDAPRGFRDYFRMQTDPQDRIVAFQLPTLYVKAVRSS